MSLGAVGAVLFVLVFFFIFSRMWFYLVESILGFLKRLVVRKKQPPAWHTLPEKIDEEK